MECTIHEKFLNLIQAIGYKITEGDSWIISFCVDKSVNHVKNRINQTVIPDGLVDITVGIALGEFLRFKKQLGQLNIDSLDFSNIESIKEGDTTVNFKKDGSDENNVDSLIDWLINGRAGDFACYRKIRW